MAYRLGVDVGGTFTDILLMDEESGATYRAKTASTPEDQSVGVLRGIERACETAGITLGDIDEVFHGTTVATNAILEGKGARVGLVTTDGFRQVLQIARSFVPGGLAGSSGPSPSRSPPWRTPSRFEDGSPPTGRSSPLSTRTTSAPSCASCRSRASRP